MEYFDHNNGAIHFLFADTDDSYYLPSSVRVPYAVYLRFFLKKNKCSVALMCREGELAPFFAGDSTSIEYINSLLSRKSETSIFGKLKSKPSGNASLIAEVISDDEKAVIIMKLSEFCSLIREGRNEKSFDVIRSAVKSRDKGDGKGILLLTAGNDAKDSIDYLKSERLRRLCPELNRAFEGDVQNPYERLDEQLEGRCCFMGTLDENRLIPALKRSYAIEGRADCVRNLKETAKFLSGYYRMCYTARCRVTDDLKLLGLPDNPKRELSLIDDYLGKASSAVLAQFINNKCDNGEFDALMVKINDNAYIHSAYPIYSAAITEKLEQIRKLCENEYIEQDTVKRAKECETRLNSIALMGDFERHKVQINEGFNSLKKSKAYADEKLETINYMLELYYEDDEMFKTISGLAHYVFREGVPEKVMDTMRAYMKALSDGVNNRKRKKAEADLKKLLTELNSQLIPGTDEEIEDEIIDEYELLTKEIKIEFTK